MTYAIRDTRYARKNWSGGEYATKNGAIRKERYVTSRATVLKCKPSALLNIYMTLGCHIKINADEGP